MGLLPENHAARIAWFQTRITLWTTNATAIGTTTTQVTDVQTKATAAAAALAAQETAQNAAKAATQALFDAMSALTNSGMTVIEQVRTKARSAGEGVYPLANIPAPATPAPVGPPGTPNNFAAELSQDGSLELTWKCSNPVGCIGVVYQVWRRTTPEGEFAYLGGAGEKKFVDATIPAGSSQLTYKIQAVRSSSIGPWATFNVTFGTESNGTVTASVVTAPKIAA